MSRALNKNGCALIRAGVLSVLASAAFIATPAAAVGTAAGQLIKNTATASYTQGNGSSSSVNSNTVTIKVDEVLNVGVAWSDGGNVAVAPNSTNQVLTYTVTNTGNGSEAFKLTARNSLVADDFDPTAYTIYLDTNGNGLFDPGVDTVYAPGTNDPVIAADGKATVFIVSSIGAQTNGQKSTMDLVATSAKGSGASGTVYPGAGVGGGNAVVGASGGTKFDTGTYQVSAANVSLVKSSVVADPFGGTTAIPGSVITYSLAATIGGTGSLTNVNIDDIVPAGSSYKAGSLTLQGTTMTDAADGDAAEVVAGKVTFHLGTVAAGQARTGSFQVIVN